LRQAWRGQPRVRGFAFAAAGAGLWGISGVVAQDVFSDGVRPQWLTALRLLTAGLGLLLIVRPPLPSRELLGTVAVSGIGLAGAQYSYFAAIAHSNVATASFIQYLAAPLIVLIERTTGRTTLRWQKLAALAVVLTGTLLLLRRPGGGMAISAAGLSFALACAVLIAVYTLTSSRVVAELGAWEATTWSSLVGAVPLVLWAPPWDVSIAAGTSGFRLAGLTAFVAVVGTLLATGLYLASLSTISAGETGTVSTTEAVAAAAFGFVLLGISLTSSQYAGGCLVLAGVVLLYLAPADPLRGRAATSEGATREEIASAAPLAE
jgi:drug/metabolite transporter (DMT)-like permease